MKTSDYKQLSSEYRHALVKLLQRADKTGLQRADEKGLQSAYELGRKAMGQGLGTIELFQIHNDALTDLVFQPIEAADRQGMYRLASEFFSESLSPYEMTHRGFTEAIDELRRQRSELIRINQTLAEKDQLFRLITDNITDMIAILDSSGRRLYNSPSYRLLLGDPESLRGTDSFADVHPDDRQRIKRVFADTIETGIGHREEYRFLTNGGNIRFIESQGNVIRDAAGVIEKVVVVSRDITARKESEEALRVLARRVVDVQEEERHRIARELHDDVCQRLTALKMEFEVMASEQETTQADLLKKLGESRSIITGIVNEIRRISANLRPMMLDELGLLPALRKLCDKYSNVDSMEVQFDSGSFDRRNLEDQVEIALYRIAQEALANALKHSEAQTVTMTLSSDQQTVSMTIADNGKGFDLRRQESRNEHEGFGLISMKERAQLAGGKFTMRSAPRKGTEIHVEIPSSRESRKKNHHRAR